MQYIIIGGGAAGLCAIEGIRKIDSSSNIILISKEKYPPYARCLITEFLIGSYSEDSLYLRNLSFYEKNKVEVILDKEVKKILTREKKVVLSDNKKISYDRVLVATGSCPKKLGIKGEDKEGVSGFRTIDDVKKIKKISKIAQRAIIFGGGLIGLKAGYALSKIGLEVEIIVKSSHILSQVVNSEAARIISRWLEKHGIKIRTGLEPVEIFGSKKMEGVLLDNGEKVEAQIGVVGKGIAPDIPETDIFMKTRFGIIVDDYMQTSAPDIYAAGDVAEVKDLITGEYTVNAQWLCAQEQGRTAGINIAGGTKRYPGSLGANAADFFGLPFVSFGKTRERNNVEIKEIVDTEKFIYKRFILRNNILIGCVLIGDVKAAGLYMALVRTKSNLEKEKEILQAQWFDYGKVKKLLEKSDGFRKSVNSEGEIFFFA